VAETVEQTIQVLAGMEMVLPGLLILAVAVAVGQELATQ
jgi:hypothetical protein